MTDSYKLTLGKINEIDFVTGRPVLILESLESRRVISLNVNLFSIGRHPKSSLVINEKTISRHHATIAWLKYTDRKRDRFGYWIIDGKGKNKRSRNGIFVNGKKTELHQLQPGDVITLGSEIKITYDYISYSTANNNQSKTIYYL